MNAARDPSINARVVEEFHANAGKVSGPWDPAGDLLLLHTIGAKSGKPRLNPLGSFRIGGKMLITASYAGADVDPAWAHNLRADPHPHIEIGTESYEVIARELPPAERDSTYAELAKAAPIFAEYQSKTDRIIPLFELERA